MGDFHNDDRCCFVCNVAVTFSSLKANAHQTASLDLQRPVFRGAGLIIDDHVDANLKVPKSDRPNDLGERSVS